MKIDKQYKIGELAQLLDIKQFVIRFWEKEFKIKPNRSNGGHRFYTNDHFEKFKLIKELLYEKKFTLEGAKKELTSKSTIIPSQKTTLETIEIKIDLDNFGKNIIELRNHLIKLKELL